MEGLDEDEGINTGCRRSDRKRERNGEDIGGEGGGLEGENTLRAQASTR